MNADAALRKLHDLSRRLEDLARVAPRVGEPLNAAAGELHAIGADLQQAYALLQAIAELTSDYGYSCRVEPDGTAVLDSATEGFVKITGYTLEEIQARGGWPALMHPDDLASSHQRS